MCWLLNKYFLSSFILRLGLGVVFLFFGVGKFLGDVWAQTIPNFSLIQMLPLSAHTIVIIIGSSEVIIGGLLIVGLFTRWVALAASVELIIILLLLNFSEIRDIGLLAGFLSLVFTGSSFLSLDALLFHNEAS